MQIALIQMPVTADKQENLRTARRCLEEAAAHNVDLAILPEMFCCPYQHKYFRPYAEPAGGPVWQALSDAARTNHIWVVGGTFPELDGEKLYNTCFVFDREGNQVARHRKIHLFDAAVTNGPHFQESATLSPGDQLTLFDTEFGKLGVCVCFDIRFPELFLLMSKAGAQAVIVPAAFSLATGSAHWELLLRSRAMDAQLFTAGVCPARNEKGYIAYGHSLACSPWGEVLAEADYDPEMLLVQMDFAKLQDARNQLPLFPARRDDLYELKWLK